MSSDENKTLREDLTAAARTRAELGPDYESAVIDGFVNQVNERIDARVDARLADRAPSKRRPANTPLWLALASLVLGIPITAIAGGTGGTMAIVVVWATIALINIVYDASRNRQSHE